MRARSEGCDEKKSSYQRGGSSSARFCSRRRRKAEAPDSGSLVAASAKRSAAHSRERENAKSSGRSACVATSIDRVECARAAARGSAAPCGAARDVAAFAIKKSTVARSCADADEPPRVAIDVVAELVRDDELRLVLGEGRDQRVAEHDAMRAADAGDERVGLARLAAHVHPKNRRVADAEACGELAQALFERADDRLERVEERHDVDRHDDVAGDEKRKRAGAGDPRPRSRSVPHRRAEQRRDEAHQRRADQRALDVLVKPPPRGFDR